MRRLLPLLLVAACAPEQAVDEVSRDPVVVYAAFEEDPALTGLFDRYTEATGVVVMHRYGKPEAIVDDLVRNDVLPPADLLMTRSAVDIWRAAEESALRPLYSEVVAGRVPDWARDTDDLWFATSADIAVIAYNPKQLEGEAIAFSSLAEPGFAGKLCLSSSKNSINRAVIALMISASDVHQAELTVRGWVGNLAAPPFATEAELAAEIAAGNCAVGVVSRSVAENIGDLEIRRPDVTIATIDAIGIGRHARNPDGAVSLIEWLFDELPAIDTAEIAPIDASIPAWNAEDARKLAERARYH